MKSTTGFDDRFLPHTDDKQPATAHAASTGPTGLGWEVKVFQNNDGTLKDCFVSAPRAEGMAYGLEVLGDDYTGYGDLAGKLKHCQMITAWANAAAPVSAAPEWYECEGEAYHKDSPGMNDWIRQKGTPLYPHPAPVSAGPLPDIRYIAKGDMRLIDGQWMTCTDPEIGRWQGSGSPVSAVALTEPQRNGINWAIQTLEHRHWSNDLYLASHLRQLLYDHAAAQAQPDAASIHLQDLKNEVAQNKELRQQISLLEEHARGECWRWQGDGTDDLSTMGNRMGVLIYACDLRALLAAQQPVSGADGLIALEGRLLEVAETVMQKWQDQERMPALAWDFRGFLVDGMRAALAQQDADKADVLPPLNNELIEILGRPNFQCIQLASALRSGGQEIANRAENEQAAVIHFLLGHYLADPNQWAENASATIDAARKEAGR